ncbi:MAG TPA: GNAT family N-acetyltransferase [Edaphocola sp.]|nr:GNAT family N-acetyltransferase [Edaphocola sp.]
MTNLITIRAYEIADKDAVISLIKWNTPRFFAQEEEIDFREYLENKRELYYVLLYNEKIVGCGGINFENKKTIGKISWDIFHPDYQGKALGTRLLEYRINTLNSIDSIRKIIVRTSQFAYKFYEKKGFEILEVIKDYWTDGFDLYYMEYKQK